MSEMNVFMSRQPGNAPERSSFLTAVDAAAAVKSTSTSAAVVAVAVAAGTGAAEVGAGVVEVEVVVVGLACISTGRGLSVLKASDSVLSNEEVNSWASLCSRMLIGPPSSDFMQRIRGVKSCTRFAESDRRAKRRCNSMTRR